MPLPRAVVFMLCLLAGDDVQVLLRCEFLAAVIAAIESSSRRVDAVCRLEQQLPAADETQRVRSSAEVRALALECARSAALLTAAAWHSAWLYSERITLPDWYE